MFASADTRLFVDSVVDCATLRSVPSRETGLPSVALVPQVIQDSIRTSVDFFHERAFILIYAALGAILRTHQNDPENDCSVGSWAEYLADVSWPDGQP